jgi:hypothetical protein
MDAAECCGSDFRFGESIPASPFHRQAVGPAVFVAQGLSSRTDVAPPSRVLDLRMKSVTEDSLYVTLEWSAPGDNYDQGRGNDHLHKVNNSLILMSARLKRYFYEQDYLGIITKA